MPSQPDLSRPFAESVVRRLREAGHQALFAGGCVRDLLLGRTPKDYDVATDARPERVREVFGHRRTLAVGASFGVVVVLPSKAERDNGVDQVEVATFRTEGPYLDGRRPERVSYSTPEEDAKRRDFTINGMFLDPIEDRVLDFVGGQADLANRVIRAIGDPRARMTEDKLRLLRAVRFAATLGFRLEDETFHAVRAMAGQLTVVSAERITQELRRMLVHERRRHAIELCDETGLLKVIFPEAGRRSGPEWKRALRSLDLLEKPTFGTALAVLLDSFPSEDAKGTSAEAICRRLRLSNDETERVVWLSVHRTALGGIQGATPCRLKRLCAHPGIVDLINLFRAEVLASGGDLRDVLFVESFLRDTPAAEIDPPPLLTGRDLIGLGLKPGPEFKRLLDAVRDAQLDGEISTTVQALDLARRLHEGGTTDTNGPP